EDFLSLAAVWLHALAPKQLGQALPQLGVAAANAGRLRKLQQSVNQSTALPIVAQAASSLSVIFRRHLESQREFPQTQMVRVEVAARAEHVVLKMRHRKHRALASKSLRLAHSQEQLLELGRRFRTRLGRRGRRNGDIEVGGGELLEGGPNLRLAVHQLCR